MRTNSRVAIGSPTFRLATIVSLTLALILLAAAAVVAGASLLPRAAIVVAQDGSGTVRTINEAVAMAVDGDTILVRPGTYAEQVDIGRAITLKGDGDRSAIVIEVPQDGRELPSGSEIRVLMGGTGTMNGAYGLLLSGSVAKVSQLTVRSPAAGLAIVVDGGAPTLEDLAIDIEGDPAPPTFSAGRTGLVIDLGSRALVRGIQHEGWLQVDRGSTPMLVDNELLDSCIEVWGEGSGATFTRNTVTGCPGGWSFDISFGATPVIEGNDISKGEIDISGSGTNPVIRNNALHDSPIAISVADASAAALMSGNRFCGNGTDLQVPAGSTLTLDATNTICEDAASPAP